jgi:transcription elongation factor Elf1
MLVGDTARFQAADDPAMVTAAFACPYCLRTASAVHLIAVVDDGTAIATCNCDVCDELWVIGLDAIQALRVRLSPPPRPRVTWRAVSG